MREEKIGLIAVDMDGTLLDADHVTVPRRNVEALKAARSRGVKVAIASGRTWSLLAGAVEQLGGVDYGVLANGAAVYDPKEGRSLYEKAMPNAQALALIRLLQAQDIPFEVYCQGQNYVDAAGKEKLEQYSLTPAFARFFERQTAFVPDLAAALAGRDVEKFDLFYVPPEKRELVTRLAKETGEVAVTQALENNMEFNRVGVNKGGGLRALAAHLGLTAEQVMAFGDADNDLEMLTWAGWSFAMESGTPGAKAAARHLAPPNTQAGVGQMVERYVLNL